MAWCAAVRKDASPVFGNPASAPVQRLQLDSLRSCAGGNNGIAVAVVDANALVSFDSSAGLLALACSPSSEGARFVTVEEVLDEVRAPESRFHLLALPCSIDCVHPSDEALQTVIRFARETGDLACLSVADMKLLALTYMLEEQAYGSAHLRTRPPPVHVAQATGMRERDLPGWGANVKNLKEWEQLSLEPCVPIEEESHILAFRRLSLNTLQQGEVLSDEEQKSFLDQKIIVNPPQGDSMDFQQNLIMPMQEECNGVEGKGEGSLVISMPEEGQSVSAGGTFCRSENGEDAVQEMEGQELEGGGSWQKAVSRSTRRKHDKRAARSAMENLSSTVEMECINEHQEGMAVIQAHRVNSDGVCNSTCAEDGDSREFMFDKTSGPIEQQAIFEEDCRSVSETSVAEVAAAPPSQDCDSEASWSLHPLSRSKVACITADFPMQNVLLQIGLRVVSPNGLQIQQLQRWALKCQACRNVTSDVGRIFCPKCGNGGTLYKVSIKIGSNGIIHTGIKKRSNIRGTKYSLPLPRGGRQGCIKNPILREDQLPETLFLRKKKIRKQDFFAPSELFALKSEGRKEIKPPLKEALAIFSGKRNPNGPRFKQRG